MRMSKTQLVEARLLFEGGHLYSDALGNMNDRRIGAGRKLLDEIDALLAENAMLQTRFDKLLEEARGVCELGSFKYRDGDITTASLLQVIEEVGDAD